MTSIYTYVCFSQAGDVASKYLPAVRYKVWGHAEQKWRGEGDSVDGKPLRPYVQPPNPADRPKKLPPVPWVTEEIKKNVRKLAGQYCSAHEREWFEDILQDGHLLNPKWIVWDGEEGEGGMAGRPGHFTVTDATGKPWTVAVRVLGPLPADLWAVPSDREARVASEYLLSEEERLRMPRVNFRNDGTAPPHPAWKGCRLLDASEVQSLFWKLAFPCSPVSNRFGTSADHPRQMQTKSSDSWSRERLRWPKQLSLSLKSGWRFIVSQ